MIYGNIRYKTEVDQTDMVGLRSLVFSKFWQATSGVDSLDELDSQTPPPPPVNLGMGQYCTRETKPVPGGMRTFWGYQGISGDGKNVTFKDYGDSLDYWFSPGFAQVDIALHPSIQSMIERYGGYLIDGQVQFPAEIDSSNSGGLTRDSGAKKNPMFGVTEFLRMEGTYFYRYLTFERSRIGSGEGRIFSSSSLPGSPPGYPGRNWLKAPTPWQRRGPVYEVVDSFWLSGPGGWPKAVYGGGSSGATPDLTPSISEGR